MSYSIAYNSGSTTPFGAFKQALSILPKRPGDSVPGLQKIVFREQKRPLHRKSWHSPQSWFPGS